MTPEEDPFIAALVADPADETTRLVYSDWLDERGEDARATYLRAEVAHFRASARERGNDEWDDMPGVDPVWAAMVSRTGVLVPGLTFTDTGPKIARADLKAIEDHWGHPLPADYAVFLLLYNGGSPSKPYLWSYEDEEDCYDEVSLFSTNARHSDGRPVLLTRLGKLLGGHCSDPEEAKAFSRMMPIGTLTYTYLEDDDIVSILALILDPPDSLLDDRVIEVESIGQHGLRRADRVHAKETFSHLLHSLVEGR